MKTRAELKQDAKDLLRGHWGRAILLVIIPLLLSWVSGSYQTHQANFYADMTNMNVHMSFWPFILSMLAWGINLGVTYTFLDWIRNPKRTVNPGTDAFRVIGSAAIFGLLAMGIISSFIIGIGFVLVIIPGVIFALMFSQSVYVYKDLHDSDPQASIWSGVWTSLSLSRQLMIGHKWEYFVMQLSFIGWWLLCMISLGIATLWVTPYYDATMAAYYDELEATSNINIAFRDVNEPEHSQITASSSLQN